MKSILLSVLALSLVPHCLSQLTTFGANYIPSIGTVVAGLPGTNHTFNCDQFSRNNNVTTKVTTAWLLENFLGLSLVSISTDDHPEFAITGTERGSNFPFPTFRNQLTIVNLTHRLHNVRLFCGHGQNTDGYWELRVYTPPLLNSNEQLSVTEGDSVSVNVSQGLRETFPFPRDFEWQKDGVIISNSTRAAFGYTLLNINPVRREDNGTYTLSATNSRLGDSESVIGTGNGCIELEIFYGPELDAAESALAAVEQANVTLMCGTNVVGHPVPSVQWRDSADSVIDTADTAFLFNNGPELVSLTILSAQLSDTGNWTCTLTSTETAVIVERMLSLTVITRPPSPVNVTINERGATWFYVSWLSPLDPPTHFTLTATPSNNESPVTLTVEQPRLSVNMTSLIPGTEYSVAVVASTLLQGVVAASHSSVTVVDSTNTSAPALVCSNTFSSDGVATVSWVLVHTGGLNLTSQEVAYATPEAVDFTPIMADLLEQSSVSVRGLSAGEFYTFRISASNALGEAVSVCPALWLTTGIPQIPLIHGIISNNPLQALLTVSTSASGTGPSDSTFQFLIQVVDTNSTLMFETSIPRPNYRDGAIVELTVSSGFVQGGDFIFTVRTENQYGTSSFSEPVRVIVADSEGAQLPVAAIAGGVGGGVLLLLLVVIIILVVVCIVRSNKTDTESKIQRCDSLEMVSNQNYGKFSEGVDTPTAVPHNTHYDTIPVRSPSIYDQLAPPPKETLSDNPLYSSTGELRLSAVFNTYNMVPPRGSSHQLTPSHQNIPLPPRPVSESDPAHSTPSPSHPTYSTPSAPLDMPPLTNHHLMDSEHLYAHATSNRAPLSEPTYSEL